MKLNSKVNIRLSVQNMSGQGKDYPNYSRLKTNHQFLINHQNCDLFRFIAQEYSYLYRKLYRKYLNKESAIKKNPQDKTYKYEK